MSRCEHSPPVSRTSGSVIGSDSRPVPPTETRSRVTATTRQRQRRNAPGTHHPGCFSLRIRLESGYLAIHHRTGLPVRHSVFDLEGGATDIEAGGNCTGER